MGSTRCSLEDISDSIHIISSKQDVHIVMNDFILDVITTKELGVSGPGTEPYDPGAY